MTPSDLQVKYADDVLTQLFDHLYKAGYTNLSEVLSIYMGRNPEVRVILVGAILAAIRETDVKYNDQEDF